MDEDEQLKKCRQHVESLLGSRSHKALQTTSYPSGSLDFLHDSTKSIRSSREASRSPKDSLCQNQNEAPLRNSDDIPRQANIKLNIIIVGAGLGGLAAAIALRRGGHAVTVFEKAPELGEVGAGIQIPPNSSRLLLKFGLGPYLEGKAAEPQAINMRRWQDGSIIGLTKVVPDFRQKFGAPFYVVHRANLQLAMHSLALNLGVIVHVNSGARSYSPHDNSILLENGETHTADLIIAADGIKSSARPIVLGCQDQPPRQPGYAAYRAMVDTDQMKKSLDSSWLLDNPCQNLWLGDQRHVMTYSIAGGKSFNMVLSHPEDSDPGTWSQDPHTILRDMKSHFEGWDPRLVKVIGMIKGTLKWPLLSGVPLKRWHIPGSKLILIGDAAHPMVPYMSEGAAMAVEDGAALAEILSLLTSPSQLSTALRVFEKVRLLRSGQMQEASLVNGKVWHFADGAEQKARDESMRAEVVGQEVESSANQWSDPVTQGWCYGYDAEEEVRRAWEREMEGSRGTESKL